MALNRRRIELILLGLYLTATLRRLCHGGRCQRHHPVVGLSMDAMAQILAR